MSVEYPQAFPGDSVSVVVAMLRKQDTPGKGKLAHAIWNVQGYLQKMILGHPDTEAILGQLNIDAETLAIALESMNPDQPQAILGGGLTNKLVFMLLSRLLDKVLAGIDLPESLEKMLDGLLEGLILVK